MAKSKKKIKPRVGKLGKKLKLPEFKEVAGEVKEVAREVGKFPKFLKLFRLPKRKARPIPKKGR